MFLIFVLALKKHVQAIIDEAMQENKMTNYSGRITANPEQCGGRPCVRGMRIRVSDVLDLYAAGLSSEQILDELPDLEFEDVQACLHYASRRISHPVLVA